MARKPRRRDARLSPVSDDAWRRRFMEVARRFEVLARPDVRARQAVLEAVDSHIAAWAASIGLTPDDHHFEEFREDVTEALHACLRAHILEPYRHQWSDVRDYYQRVAQLFTAAAQLLRLQNIGPFPAEHYPDLRFRDLPPLTVPPNMVAFLLTRELAKFGDAEHFKRQAAAARRYAKACPTGKRGHPRHLAFDMLMMGPPLPIRFADRTVAGLKQAFERATEGEATITRREDLGEWGGDFWRLVEAVLPVAQEIALKVTGTPLAAPESAEARGKYLQRHVCKSARKRPSKRKSMRKRKNKNPQRYKE